MLWKHVEGGRRFLAPLILNLDVRWWWIFSFIPRSLYPLGKRLGDHWILGWVGHSVGLNVVEKKKVLSLSRIESRFLGFQDHILVFLMFMLNLFLIIRQLYFLKLIDMHKYTLLNTHSYLNFTQWNKGEKKGYYIPRFLKIKLQTTDKLSRHEVKFKKV
jgi:hypothetical protein